MTTSNLTTERWDRIREALDTRDQMGWQFVQHCAAIGALLIEQQGDRSLRQFVVDAQEHDRRLSRSTVSLYQQTHRAMPMLEQHRPDSLNAARILITDANRPPAAAPTPKPEVTVQRVGQPAATAQSIPRRLSNTTPRLSNTTPRLSNSRLLWGLSVSATPRTREGRRGWTGCAAASSRRLSTPTMKTQPDRRCLTFWSGNFTHDDPSSWESLALVQLLEDEFALYREHRTREDGSSYWTLYISLPDGNECWFFAVEFPTAEMVDAYRNHES